MAFRMLTCHFVGATVAWLFFLAGIPAALAQSHPPKEQIEFSANVEKLKGHLLVSLELYEKGEATAAAIHAAHPIQELWGRIRAPIGGASAELAARISSLLEKPNREIEAKVPPKHYSQTVREIFSAIDQAENRIVPVRAREDLSFRAKLILELLEEVVEEYSEGVQEGKVIQFVEYQDAFGFFRRAHALYRTITGALKKKDPASTRTIDGALAELARGLAKVTPPEKPLSTDRVRDLVKRVVNELGACRSSGHEPSSDRGERE